MALTRAETHARIARVTELAQQGRMPVECARAAIVRLRKQLSLLDLVGA